MMLKKMVYYSMEKILFEELLNIMRRLRGKEGCPWDRAQTIESLKPFLIEETYEVIEAIEEGNGDKIQEELGDLLYQIIFLAQIGQEEGKFDIGTILNTISGKMVRRHPHVFSNGEARDAAEVLAKWEEIKKEEHKGKGEGEGVSIMKGIPKGLPSMVLAHRVQDRASRVGFDWSSIEEVLDKLDEEVLEFKECVKKREHEGCAHELGDILFTIVNLSRFLGFDPEGALRKATLRFVRRFQCMEEMIAENGKLLQQLDITELDKFWELAKTKTV